MQQGMNQGRIQFQIVGFSEECLQIKTLCDLVLPLPVSRLSRRRLTSMHLGTASALGKG
jgi:hypothetical protein